MSGRGSSGRGTGGSSAVPGVRVVRPTAEPPAFAGRRTPTSRLRRLPQGRRRCRSGAATGPGGRRRRPISPAWLACFVERAESPRRPAVEQVGHAERPSDERDHLGLVISTSTVHAPMIPSTYDENRCRAPGCGHSAVDAKGPVPGLRPVDGRLDARIARRDGEPGQADGVPGTSL